MEKKTKYISPAMFALIVLCFFLPFVNVSCENQQIVSMSGIQLVTGTSVENQYIGDKEEIPADAKVIVAFACAATGIIVGLQKGKIRNGLSAILGAIGFTALLLFKSGFGEKVAERGDGMLKAQFESGLWVAMVLFLVATIAHSIPIFRASKIESIPLATGANLQIEYKDQQVNSRFCDKCGAELSSKDAFCTNCGNKIS